MAKSLYEFGKTIIQIREAIDSIEVKGRKNASFIVYASNNCDDLIEEINEITRNAENAAPEPTINEETDGDLNERDSGCS